MKFKYDGFYTVIVILSSAEDSEENDLFKIKPEGRGRTKVVNVSKLKRAFGPYIKSSIKLTTKRTIEKHVDKVIDKVAIGIVQVPLNDMTSDVLQQEEEEASEQARPIDTNNELNHDESDFLFNDVNEIVEMIDELDGSIEG